MACKGQNWVLSEASRQIRTHGKTRSQYRHGRLCALFSRKSVHKFFLGMALSFTALASHGACADKPAPNVDWNGCDKHGVNLEGANLQGADLQGADLRGATLKDADFQAARLEGSDLGSMRRNGVFLGGANLQGANLQAANLKDSNLDGANLAGANLQGANLYRATWTDGKKVCGPDSIGVCK